jgi:hypothetical protein
LKASRPARPGEILGVLAVAASLAVVAIIAPHQASSQQPDSAVSQLEIPQLSAPPPKASTTPPCPLCAEDPGAPIRVLTIEEARRIGDSYADSNIARITRLDSLLQAGDFGSTRDSRSSRRAHLLARLWLLNAYSYMARFGADPDTIWQADEETLRPAFDTFSDPGIVPLLHLSRARMGLGHMCAQYDLREKERTETTIGGRRLAVRIDDVNIQGQQVRALIMDLPTSLDDVVEVWLLEHVSMNVERFVVPGPPAPYEAYILSSMRGLWVRKAGLHRPEAFVFWVTPRDPSRPVSPAVPLAGARIYVPHLKLRLPVLPDLGFEDLRPVDLPQPILPIAYLREKRFPSWLRAASIRGFQDWEGVGPLPVAIRQRFPDK